jgi:MoaA/NifB/PqqE/SkfB family radical SAM enzyme
MTLEKRELYRLPWSKNDNPIAWLEVTDVCNLRCEGCYRQRLSGHKPIEQVKEEIRFFQRWRNPDNVSIAGGEPLLHPQIVDIVADIAEKGVKPIILTNAAPLTPALLRELKRAGLSGFTIHIDSHQSRPHWEGKNEAEHNELRAYYADMIAAEGGLVTVFNSTVYPSTLDEIPDVLRWGQANLDRVHGLVFITYRTFATEETVAIDQAGQEVAAERLSYSTERYDEQFVTGPEVVQLIQEHCAGYAPCGYLGGTIRHDSFKWLVAATIGSKHGTYGSVGRVSMELAQAGHHLLRGTYLAYLSTLKIAPLTFLMAPWDRGVRHAARTWLADVVRHPVRLFAPIRLQTIGIIQAPDEQPNGQADMCDSCPDMTVWNGTLINSCRMDEYRLFGGMLSVGRREKAVPREEGTAPIGEGTA